MNINFQLPNKNISEKRLKWLQLNLVQFLELGRMIFPASIVIELKIFVPVCM